MAKNGRNDREQLDENQVIVLYVLIAILCIIILHR